MTDANALPVVGPINPEKISKLLGNISQHRASAADLLDPNKNTWNLNRTPEERANIQHNIDIMDTAITILILLVEGHNKLESVETQEQKLLGHIAYRMKDIRSNALQEARKRLADMITELH